MPSNIKRIVIAAAAVVVVALALVIMVYVFPEKEVIPVESPSPTPEEVNYLVHHSGTDVTRIFCDYRDGNVFDIKISQENGKYVYDVYPEDDFFGYNTSRLHPMMFTVSSVTATSKIEENPKDLSDYGLDDPSFTLTVSFSDGNSVTINVGNETPVRNYYYAITDKDNTVYTIGNYLTTLFSRKPYEYRAVDSFPTYTDEDIYENIVHFSFTRRDGVYTEIMLDKDLSMEGNITSSAYMMLQPFVSPCTTDAVEDLLEVLATLTQSSIRGDITKDELSEYGLDKPARLFLENPYGNSLEIVVGTVGSNECYAAIGREYDALMAGEVEHITLLTYTISNFDWLDLNYMNLQIRTPWIINIHNVDKVLYDFGGDTFEMILYEYDDVTGSGIEVVRTCSHINGKDIGETNTKRIYSRTLNFRQVSAMRQDVAYDPDYENSITIFLKDGTERSMHFHKINERQYACELDGAVEYYIYSSNLTTLRTALDRAMDDREVSLVYDR